MEERLAEAAGALAGPTRQQEGCIDYDLHRSAEDPSEFVFYENWRSQEDLERHLKSPHVEKVLEQLPELSENGVEITIFERVSAATAR